MDQNQKIKSMGFEESMLALEKVVRRLEEGGQNLEEAIADYEFGARLRQHCEQCLKEASLKIEKITLNANGDFTSSAIEADSN